MTFRHAAVAAVVLAALSGCSSTDTPTTSSSTSTTATAAAPTEVPAGWEGFCAAMEDLRFDGEPAGGDLDRLAAATEAVAAAAPEEIGDAAALFDATLDAAIAAARDVDGVLRRELLYELAPEGSEPLAAIDTVFGAAQANCPAPVDTGS